MMKEAAAGIKKLFSCSPDSRTLKLNNDTGMLKLLACVLMLLDHTGKMIFGYLPVLKPAEWLDGCIRAVSPSLLSPERASGIADWVKENLSFLLPSGLNIMRLLGRIAMPLFAYCVAVGCSRTRNIWKYIARLFLLAILVQPLYQEAMGHVRLNGFDWAGSWYDLKEIYRYYYARNLNILFTLGFAALLLGLIRCRRYELLVFAAAAVCCLSGRLDYGFRGVMLIVLFYAVLDRPLAALLLVGGYFLWWAYPREYFSISGFAIGGSRTEIYAIWALVPICLPVKKRLVKLPKWLFYGFYPAHLALLYLHLLCTK